jgi:putative MATE family efflux protein
MKVMQTASRVQEKSQETFFVREKSFYTGWLSLLLFIALQNLIAYSVNMADNIMLGSYRQSALSGATIVNQIFFVIQFLATALGEGIVVLGAQYWGKKEVRPIRTCIGIALRFGLLAGIGILLVCMWAPVRIIQLFTLDQPIVTEAVRYLDVLQISFPFFIASTILYAGLRAVKIVRIAFWNSILSLLINVVCNYLFIYGHGGCPELGAQGAAIGTVIARVLELGIIVGYLYREKRLSLFSGGLFARDPQLQKDYLKITAPILGGQFLWALTTPIQTAILGHLASDAIAANSVATTFYQYLKVIVQAMCSATSVTIGHTVGMGDFRRIRQEGRTLSVIFVGVGLSLGGLLYALRRPLLSFYDLNPQAMALADQLMIVMSVVMVGMSYQMPVSSGIIRGGGDTRYGFLANLISTWVIVIPLSLAGAFMWKLPVVQVVMLLQSDQIFKGIPAFLWYNSFRWVKKLTR